MHIHLFSLLIVLCVSRTAGSPSAPLFDLNSPPMLDGTDVTLVWLPSDDAGGDPNNLYYDVYAAQLGGDNPTFRRQNDGPIDDSELSSFGKVPTCTCYNSRSF